ncbi:DUF2975 domain-containing protein [Companilactobacillus ginsenosidimutans]|uniref:DUF2975 domain-containing protein n=1 Tax=Companilactobacillus ginsenosidimutans TaxID=1007676 RepID=UPI000661733A|nr:DUF2975 domain-containing protein [Companilactobacillus ginsenosidimutans]
MRKFTLFLRFSLLLLFLGPTFFAGVIFPTSIYLLQQGKVPMYQIVAFTVGVYTSVILTYGIIACAWYLINRVDKNEILTQKSRSALRWIKRLAVSISAVYTLMIPLFLAFSIGDCLPGPIVVDIFLIGLGITIAAFAGMLEKICLNEMEKSGQLV